MATAANSDEFMERALKEAEESPDPDRKVGACIVNANKEIVGVGHNRYPRGCEGLKWDKKEKLLYVLHAEANVILNVGAEKEQLKGCSLYVTLFPCNECAKLIVESGIKNVFYHEKKESHMEKFNNGASIKMFDKSGVVYQECNNYTAPRAEKRRRSENTYPEDDLPTSPKHVARSDN